MQGTGGFGRCNIATGSVPLPPFLLLLAPIRTAQRQFLFLINPLHRFFLALSTLPCPVPGAAASLCLPLYYSRLRIITTSPISPATTIIQPRRRFTSRRQLSLLCSPSTSPAATGTCDLLCCCAGRPERIAIPHFGNPEAAESATGAAPLWTSIAIFFVSSSAVSVHRIRSCHPSSPSLASSQTGQPIVTKKKKRGQKIHCPRLTARLE